MWNTNVLSVGIPTPALDRTGEYLKECRHSLLSQDLRAVKTWLVQSASQSVSQCLAHYTGSTVAAVWSDLEYNRPSHTSPDKCDEERRVRTSDLWYQYYSLATSPHSLSDSHQHQVIPRWEPHSSLCPPGWTGPRTEPSKNKQRTEMEKYYAQFCSTETANYKLRWR